MKKTLSLILALTLALSLGAVALADDEPVGSVAASVEISLRIEGKTANVFYNPAFVVVSASADKKPTALDAVNAFAEAEPDIEVKIEESEYGSYLAAVGDDAENTTAGMDGWMFLINGEPAVASIGASELSRGDVVVFYYSDEYGIGLQRPEADESRLASEGVVRFTSRDTTYDENWAPIVTVNPVAGATVTWNGDTYVTDANGEIRPEKYLASYNAAQIERYDEETGIPTVLRYAPDYVTSFPDIEADWYADAVRWCVEDGVINGADGKFSPAAYMTRAALVTVLHRYDGSPETPDGAAALFSDVEEGSWYFGAVAWAAANGIAGGADGEFNPDGYVTRQDLAVILERYMLQYKKLNVAVTMEYILFADEDEIADYAKNAAQLLYKLGIMKGEGDVINPLGTATRAEIAVLLRRFDEFSESYAAEAETETEAETPEAGDSGAETEAPEAAVG
jgi:hypothetical protein